MINDALFSSQSEEWATPQDLFDELNVKYGFSLDPCATADNRKCEKFYSKADDGLIQSWHGETVFCNPPYGRAIGAWAHKCYEASQDGATVVLLVPARTDTAWFHDWLYNKARLLFVRGRLKFGGSKNSAPFPSLVAIYNERPELICS